MRYWNCLFLCPCLFRYIVLCRCLCLCLCRSLVTCLWFFYEPWYASKSSRYYSSLEQMSLIITIVIVHVLCNNYLLFPEKFHRQEFFNLNDCPFTLPPLQGIQFIFRVSTLTHEGSGSIQPQSFSSSCCSYNSTDQQVLYPAQPSGRLENSPLKVSSVTCVHCPCVRL